MKRIIQNTLLVFGICILLFACSGGGNGDDSAAVSDNDTPPEDVAPSNTSQLARFSSDDELAAYLKSGLTTMTADPDPIYAAPEADAGSPGGDVLGPRFSTTNLQESGVDEADIVKTDGRYLYMIQENNKYDYLPEVDAFAPPSDEGESAVRVMEISADPAQTREITSVSLAEFENPVDGLYLVTDRGNGNPDLLVTVGGTQQNMWLAWECLGCWRTGTAEVGLFNVSSPENPELITRITLDGQLIASRRIDNMLYLVTRFTPGLDEVIPYPQTEEDREWNKQVIADAPLTDLLPKASFGGGAKAALVRTDQVYLPPLNEDREPQPNLITVTAVDLEFPESPVSRSIAGPAETVYVGTENLYVATVRYPHPVYAERDVIPEDTATLTTQIHKFSLTQNGPVYKASGSVLGGLGWEEDKKPFRMGEYEGTLRIATSLGDTWDGSATTRLTLLKEGADGLLEETGSIENIGKPGERLYAVRFVGPKGYLVTFRVTDPLYVFDLSDPYQPTTLGELQIEGYSDYLHPIDDNLLLGIGKDAVPDNSASDFGGRGAWYQGVKLALFDVSGDIDPNQPGSSNPREWDSLVIGKRGTESAALSDHHALAYLPPEAGQPAKLALPIRLHDTPSDADWFDPNRPDTYYEWTHTGLYLFEIDTETNSEKTPQILRSGNLVVADRSTSDPSRLPPFWHESNDRAVILEGSVHYLHEGRIWSGKWETPEDFIGPE
jgi:uncharacterized secreted protein with C-terminal beta-propeller domain